MLRAMAFASPGGRPSGDLKLAQPWTCTCLGQKVGGVGEVVGEFERGLGFGGVAVEGGGDRILYSVHGSGARIGVEGAADDVESRVGFVSSCCTLFARSASSVLLADTFSLISIVCFLMFCSVVFLRSLMALEFAVTFWPIVSIFPISEVSFVMFVPICPNSSVNWLLSWFATWEDT